MPELIFRNVTEADRENFLSMSRIFHSPPATLHVLPQYLAVDTFNEALSAGPYVRGLVFELDGETVGYAVLSFKFETEVGSVSVWVEELFICEGYRGIGIGSQFVEWLKNEYLGKFRRIRLEVNSDNAVALLLYAREGFETLDYKQMVLDRLPE